MKQAGYVRSQGPRVARRIISGTLQVLLGMRYWGRSASEAISAPRLHHQWMPDAIAWEDDARGPDDGSALEGMGHQFEKTSRGIGVVQGHSRGGLGLRTRV